MSRIIPPLLGSAVGGGGGGYVAKAVHFDGNSTLNISSLTATDGSDFSMVFWLNPDWAAITAIGGAALSVVDPENTYVDENFLTTAAFNTFQLQTNDVTGSKTFSVYIDSPGAPVGWNGFIYTASTNFSAGNKKGKLYMGDVDVTDIAADSASAFSMVFNGLSFWLFGDGFGTNYTGDAADIRVMPGVSLLDGTFDIPLATRRLFIGANGKPVDPAVATAALGTSGAILCSGDASPTGFQRNQGPGGAIIVNGDPLTNASTSPSD